METIQQAIELQGNGNGNDRCPNTNRSLTDRISWVDAGKCIGILLVMFGHNWLHPKYCYWIYAFHMPLFFILAGYTFSSKNIFFKFVGKKAKALLIPYITFALVGGGFLLSFKLRSYRSFSLKRNGREIPVKWHSNIAMVSTYSIPISYRYILLK